MSRIHTVKNINEENILVKLVAIFKLIFTVSAHYIPASPKAGFGTAAEANWSSNILKMQLTVQE